MIKRIFIYTGKRSHNIMVQYALGALYGNFALWGLGAVPIFYKMGQNIKRAMRQRKPKQEMVKHAE